MMPKKLNHYQVVIIGAGPAGGQCARELSAAGKKVLMIERFKDFRLNDFSSAGTIMETLRDFELPDKVIGGKWDTLIFGTEKKLYEWKSRTQQGIVFDFAGLRRFLVEEATKSGAKVRMGWRYGKRWYDNAGKLHVEITTGKETEEVTCDVLVDGTGPARAVIYQPGEKQPQFSNTPGVEYLLKLKKKKTRRPINDRALYFFVGKTWAPAGYSWIFPMQKDIFKFGVGANAKRFNDATSKPLSEYIEILIKEFIGHKEYEILDRHGSIVRGAFHRDDKYYEKNIIAMGDAISTIFPIAGEGVRHALHSGRIAAQSILLYLDGQKSDFAHYESAMKKYMGWNWWLGEQFMHYFNKHVHNLDQEHTSKMDKWFEVMKKFSLEDIVDLLFRYNVWKLMKLFPQILWI